MKAAPLLFAALLLLGACKDKKKEDPTPTSPSDLLVGQWELYQRTREFRDLTTDAPRYTLTTPVTTADILAYYNTGRWEYVGSSGGTWTYTAPVISYTLISPTPLRYDTLDVLTATQMVKIKRSVVVDTTGTRTRLIRREFYRHK